MVQVCVCESDSTEVMDDDDDDGDEKKKKQHKEMKKEIEAGTIS